MKIEAERFTDSVIATIQAKKQNIIARVENQKKWLESLTTKKKARQIFRIMYFQIKVNKSEGCHNPLNTWTPRWNIRGNLRHPGALISGN